MKKLVSLLTLALILAWILSKCDNKSEISDQPAYEPTASERKSADSLASIAAKNRILEEEERAKREAMEEKKFLKSKAGRIWKRHPEWSKEDCELLASNKIWIGMTYSMLKYKRGLPNHANPSNYGNGTQWQWCWDDYTPSCFYDHDDDGKIDSYN